MNKEPDPHRDDPRPPGNERMVFLIPSTGESKGQIDYRELWDTLWAGKWLVVAITAVFSVLAVVYALVATEWYTASVVLTPSKSKPALSGDLGGLASLASLPGVTIGESGDTVEALAVLRSREFARAFIEEHNLLPVLFAEKWDAEQGRWKGDDPKAWPDVRDGIKFFENNVRRVAEDKKNGVITVSVQWKDASTAARWANLLVARVNERMRERALKEAEQNAKFLRAELEQTNIVTLQQSISRLLENELKTLMVARANREYAFRVVDPAAVPKWRSRPKRTILVVVWTMAGGIIGVLAVFARHAIRRERVRT